VAFFVEANKNLISFPHKFHFLKSVLESPIYGSKIKYDFFLSFFQIQKVFWKFKRLLFLWKFKKAQTQIETDLLLQEIPKCKTTSICILHEGKKYWFLYRDLMKLIVNSISNSSSFFAAPIAVKNPYNNTIFPKSVLYSIYFGLLQTKYFIPTIIHHYFKCNFDLSKFTIDYEHVIRENAIKNYVTNLLPEDAVYFIKKMLKSYNSTLPSKYHIVLDPEFPKEKTINVFKRYLIDYFSFDYSIVVSVKLSSLVRLKNELLRFRKLNPGFGRKVFKLVNRKAVPCFIDNAKFPQGRQRVQQFLISHEEANYSSLAETHEPETEDDRFQFVPRNDVNEAQNNVVRNEDTQVDENEEEDDEESQLDEEDQEFIQLLNQIRYNDNENEDEDEDEDDTDSVS
jgi:hypothetical protein